MISAGENVPTVATSVVLAVYAWPPGSERYGRVSTFVNLFFNNIEKFAKPPRHPAWADVNLAAEVPGWTRFSTAKEWLDNKRREKPDTTSSIMPSEQMKKAFVTFIDEFSKAKGSQAPMEEAEKSALWSQFQQWWVQQNKH